MYRIKVSTATTDYVAYQNRDLTDAEFADLATGTVLPADEEVYTWDLQFAGPFFYNAVWNETLSEWCNNLAPELVDAARVAWWRENLP
jgi:hypothetical protein